MAGKLTKLPTGDSAADRWQDHVIQAVNPALGNPVLNLVDWRINEGPYPTATSSVCLLLQHRAGPVWSTVRAFNPDGTDIITDKKSISPGTNITAGTAPNAPTSYRSFDGKVTLAGTLTATNSIALFGAIGTINSAHAPNRTVYVPAIETGVGDNYLIIGSNGVIQCGNAMVNTNGYELSGITYMQNN